MLLVRYVLYVLLIAAFLGIFAWVEIATPGALKLHILRSPSDLYGTSEYSPIELVQPALLGLCVLLYAWVVRDCPSQRPVALTFGAFALACMVRELHFFLDENVADNFWQVVVAIILALIIAYGYRQRRRFRVACLRLWPSPGLVLLFVSGVMLFVIVQIVGHDPLWQALLGEGYQRIVKLAVEEFFELVGYFFAVIGTLEYVYEARALASGEPRPVPRTRRRQRPKRAARR